MPFLLPHVLLCMDLAGLATWFRLHFGAGWSGCAHALQFLHFEPGRTCKRKA